MRRVCLAILLAVLTAATAGAAPQTHPLLEYVQAPDSAYTWSKQSEAPGPGGSTLTRVDLTSQVWQGIPWQHVLGICRPAKMRPGTAALLVITGGSGRSLGEEYTLLATAANSAGIPIAVLFGIPNQPLFDGKKEDALIAHTFLEYFRTRDQSWPLLYPMTKSAVRAMDTLQQFAAQEWQTTLPGFVVTGASKRGWTTWLTGACDPRVLGIAPMVYDNLNLGSQMRQQLACYGGYSEQIGDYSATPLLDMLTTPAGKAFADMVDPYALRARLKMPKLIINGSNDRYWTLESANLYFNDLPGERRILYVPNAGHGLGNFQDVVASVLALTRACSEKKTLPPLTWNYRETPAGLQLTIRARAPQRVSVWTATSPTTDFRDARWTEQPLAARGGRYSFTLARPTEGYAAVFGEARVRHGEFRFPLSTTPRMLAAKAR